MTGITPAGEPKKFNQINKDLNTKAKNELSQGGRLSGLLSIISSFFTFVKITSSPTAYSKEKVRLAHQLKDETTTQEQFKELVRELSTKNSSEIEDLQKSLRAYSDVSTAVMQSQKTKLDFIKNPDQFLPKETALSEKRFIEEDEPVREGSPLTYRGNTAEWLKQREQEIEKKRTQ